MDVNSGQGHQSPPEEIPSSDSLGLQHPLLPPPALGQSFLQPHTLSPLGTVSLISLDTPANHPHISRSSETQVPKAQSSSLTPTAPTEILQPKLGQSSPHQKQPKAPNNPDRIFSEAAHAPEVEQSLSIETSAVLNVDQPRAAAPSIQPAQDGEQETRKIPATEQAESVKQIAQDQISLDKTLQSNRDQAPELSPPSTKSQIQESAHSSVPSSTEDTPRLQKSSEVASKQSITEAEQKPEQTTQQAIAHPSSKAISPEVSASSNPTEVPPLQTKHQDVPEIQATSQPSTLQESPPKSREQTTPPNSAVKSSSLEPSPIANPTNSDSSPTKALGVSTHLQPNLQKVSSADDHSSTPSAPTAQAAQSKEEPVQPASPLSSQKPVISSQPGQEQQVSNARPPESQSVPIQPSLEVTAPDIKVTTTPPTPPAQTTDITTDLPASQTSPISPSERQTSKLQSSLANSTVEANNPSSAIDSGSSVETPVTPSPKAKLHESPIQTTTVQTVAQSSPQQSSDDQPLLLENAKTSSSKATTPDSSTESTTIQKSESSTAQQPPTAPPITPQVEANQTSPTNEPPSVKNPTTPSTSKKADRETIQAKTLQRADTLSPQTSAKKQQKKSKNSKRKKIPLQARLSRMGERAKQDINKVGIQLKQASPSLPVGQSKAKAKGLQKSASGSPQPTNAPSIQAKSSSDSKQSSSEVSLVQSEAQAIAPVSPQKPSREEVRPEKTESANPKEISSTVQAIPESIDSPQEYPHSTPIQTKPLGTDEPTMAQGIHSSSVTGLNERTESTSDSKDTGQHKNQSESSAPEASADQLKIASSSGVTSSAGSNASRSTSKKRGQLPAHPLQRLTHFSQQVMDTVSRQLEPHPNEEVIPLQKQKQYLPKNSDQNRKDQSISPTSSQKSGSAETQPTQSGGGDETTAADIQTKPFSPNTAPGTAIHSEPKLRSDEQKHPDSQIDRPTDATVDKNIQTQALPTVQKAEESQPARTTLRQPENVDLPSSSRIEASSPLEGNNPASVVESQPNTFIPGWQSIQNQLADRITNLGSQIKERADRSIRKQRSKRQLPQPSQIKEADSVESATSNEITQNNITQQPAEVPELNGASIQASAEPFSDPVNDNEQPILTDSVQRTSSSNPAIESLDQTDTSLVVHPAQEDSNHPQELTTELSIQSSAVDQAKTPQPHQDSGQNEPALISEPEKSIQRTLDSAEITSTSSDQPITDVSNQSSENLSSAISNSSQSRNLPFNSHISKIGTTIVQQLANLRPKKTKSKRKTHKQKPASTPVKISSEKTEANTTFNPTLLTAQEKTSQSTDQPNLSEQPTVQTPSSPTTESAVVVQRQHGDDAASVKDPMVSDQPSSKPTAIDTSSIQPESIAPDIPSPLADSSIERHSSTAEIVQKQPITPEATNSKPADFESSSSFSEPELQQQTELSSLTASDSVQLSPQTDSATQSEAIEPAVSTPGINDSIQRQDITHQQSSQLDHADGPINPSKTSTTPSSHPLLQTELSLQNSKGPSEDPGVSDTSDLNPNNLLQRETTQEQSQPERPNSQTQNLLTQNVLETESSPLERPPISEISVQTKVEQPSVTHQPQQQLPASPNSSVQQSSKQRDQISSESQKSNFQEDSEVVREVDTSETVNQNLNTPNAQTSQIKGRDHNIPNSTSPTIQAKEHPFEEVVSEQSLSASDIEVTAPNPDNRAIASTQISQDLESQEHNASQASSNSSVASNNFPGPSIVQREIETHLDNDQPLVISREDLSNVDKPLNAQSKIPETPVLREASTQTESNPEISNLESKQTSTVPIQSVEISVVQPTAESQLQKGSIGQSFDNCDRTPESPQESGHKPTPESQLPQPIEPSERQQAAAKGYSDTSSTTDTSLSNDLPHATIEPVIQASSIEPSHDSSTAPTDRSETSEIIQSEHPPNIVPEIKVDSDLPPSPTSKSQATPSSSTKQTISDTQTPDLQQLPTKNTADSSPQTAESIQAQSDPIDSTHHRLIEIAAQRPDENIENANLPHQDISASSSSDQNEHQILQRSLERDSSLGETDLAPTNPDISSKVGEKPKVAERPQLKSDAKRQTSDADSSGSSLASTQPLSSPPIKSTIQRQEPSGGTLDALEIAPVNAQPDSLQRRVIEIAAQPPDSERPEGNSPDLTVAQLLATGQSPSLLSNIADNFVSPKSISSLLSSSKPNRKHHFQKPSNFQSPNIPLELNTRSDEIARSEEGFEVSMESAPTIQPSSNPVLPSSWSSIEDLFTVQAPSVIQRQAEPQSLVPADTSDLVLTPTGIHPEKLVQRKPASVQRPPQKTAAAPPQVSSPPQITEVVMRQSQTEKSTESEVDEQSFEILAREIYHVLRQRLEVERERHGGYQSGRLPW